MRLLTTVCFSSLLLLSLADGSQSQENDSKQPFDLTPSLDEAMSSAHLHKDEPAVSDPTPEPEPEPEPEPTAIATPVSEPEPEPTPEPQPEPEPTVQDLKKATEPQGAPEPSPEPEPEPAIKFDNIDQSEDYGDVAEVKNTPDAVDDGIIEELVERFLNTGSVENQKNETKFTNPAAQALINSSPYWNTDDLKPPGTIKDAEETKKWLEGYQTEAAKVLHEVAASGWKYVANASPFAKTALNEAEQVLSRFVRSTAMQAKQFDFEQLSDSALQRQMNFVTFEGMSALSPKSYASFNQALHKINRDISDTAVCDQDMSPPCALKKIDLESIFHNEKDASRLSTLWVNYVTGIAKTKSSYQTIIDRSNEGAKLNGFADGGAMWRSAFDLSTKSSPPVYDMKKRLNELYQSIKPFYTQLHAYLRRQIAGMYENASDLSKDGPIPAHLFGSVKGGDWSSHYEQTKPYDDEESVAEDMLNAFRVQNYTSKQMFIKAYRYFKSVGFPVLPRSFWTKSLFSRVWSKDMICNPPAAIDMRDGVDFRVKACAQLGEPDFQLAHSLLAQTYYQYLYKEQPLLFREPAASPINDAISKVFSHLASNPHYLYSQKLVPSSHLDIKDALIVNRLYKEALENFAKLPFDISSDFWRYELFEGKIPVSKSNDAWWELRKKYEGVRAPQPYNSSNIDAFMHSSIAQVHNPATRGMISYIAQFQILKAICPEGAMLSEGCILSEDTTEKLRETMKMGSSITWLQALEMITGSDKLDATPMLEYYEPLISWLNNINELNQVVVGWDGPGTPFSPEEIPKTRSDMDGESGILSQDRVAFPGGECTHGQECLLDSHCNGTACVCNEGLYTLEIGDTVNCVPGNPADSGFGDGKGGLVIGLFASETTPEPEPSSTTKRPVRVKSAIFTYPTYLLSALILICLL